MGTIQSWLSALNATAPWSSDCVVTLGALPLAAIGSTGGGQNDAGHGEVWVVFNVGGPIFAAGTPVTGLGQVGAFQAGEVVPGDEQLHLR